MNKYFSALKNIYDQFVSPFSLFSVTSIKTLLYAVKIFEKDFSSEFNASDFFYPKMDWWSYRWETDSHEALLTVST